MQQATLVILLRPAMFFGMQRHLCSRGIRLLNAGAQLIRNNGEELAVCCASSYMDREGCTRLQQQLVHSSLPPINPTNKACRGRGRGRQETLQQPRRCLNTSEIA